MRPRPRTCAKARAFVLMRFGRQARVGLNAELRRSVALLRQHPFAGKPAGATAREYVLDGYPYSLIYSAERDEIVIRVLYHHSRGPSFWQERLSKER